MRVQRGGSRRRRGVGAFGGERKGRVAGVRYMGRLLVSLMAISQTDKCRDLSTFACFTPFSLRLPHGCAFAFL